MNTIGRKYLQKIRSDTDNHFVNINFFKQNIKSIKILAILSLYKIGIRFWCVSNTSKMRQNESQSKDMAGCRLTESKGDEESWAVKVWL